MRISDWSSDVCSSDLPLECIQARPVREKVPGAEDELLDGGTGRVEDDAGVAHRRTPAFLAQGTGDGRRFPASRHVHQRSEEHTSELPSLMRYSYAVFCLEKKTLTNVRSNDR